MYLFPVQTWTVAKDTQFSPEEMADQLIGTIGSNRQFSAVGISVAGRFDRSIAFCDPLMAERIVAGPDLAAALESMIRWSEDFEHGDRARAEFQKPIIFEKSREALKAFHGRDLPLFKAA